MSTEQIASAGTAGQPLQDPADGTPDSVQSAAAGGAVWAAPRAPAPSGATKRWSAAKIAVVGALTVALAVGAGVGVSHLSSGSTASQAAGPGGAGGFGGQGAGAQGAGGPGAGLGPLGGGGSLHGDYVVSDGNGGYTTRRTQTGSVTAASSSSISVQSADGFTSTYAITSATTVTNGTVAGLKTGATVSVVGTVSDSTATATTITPSTS